MTRSRRAFPVLYVRAEWTKLRTAPETLWLVLGAVAATVAVGLMVTINMPCTPVCGDVTKSSLTGVQLGQAVIAVLAVLGFGGEYATGMIHVSLAAMPRRTGVLVAKAAAVTAVVSAASVAAVVVSLAVLPFGDAPVSSVLRAIVGSVLYLVCIGLLSVGVVALVRNAAAAAGIVLALLYLFPILASAAPDPAWERHLLQTGPMTAGLAVQATKDLSSLPISPWTGLGVTAAWALGALLLGGLALRVRDA